MSYKALYRKFRPNTFDGVVGQDHITKTLKNQIIADRIAHAYLFCGTRGTGKTSTAKILAQAVNCQDPREGNPCHACDVCKLINSSQNMNIIEIDAASNNGVDNIREIREEVRYTPTDGRFKVYIIDEVHMLSTGAFNALLKTLEEPPSHVIFILATTEPHKIPITILSRCQRYDFKRISRKIIADEMASYMVKDQVDIEAKGIEYIAKVADGSMRDGLSILDQCIAFYLGETITYEKILAVLGAVDTQVFMRLAEALSERDSKKCLNIVEEISDQGRDIDQFVVDVIGHFRNMLLVKTVKQVEDVLDLSREHIHELRTLAEHFDESTLMYFIRHFSKLENQLKYIVQKRIILEVELIKLCHPEVSVSNEGILERVVALEDKLKQGVQVFQGQPIQEEQAPLEQTKKVEKKIYEEALPTEVETAMTDFVQVINRSQHPIKAMLASTTRAYLGNGPLYIICPGETVKNTLKEKDNHDKIVEALESIHQKRFELEVVTETEFDRLAHDIKDSSSGVVEAKDFQANILAKINYDNVEEISQ